jgi:HK97 family phage portal protein
MFGFNRKQKLENEVTELRKEINSLKNESSMYEQFSEFFSSLSSSGISVNSESAKRCAAAYSCGRLLAGSVALLPLPIYERQNNTRTRVDHDFWWLLNESPYPTLTACSFWEWMMSSVLFKGDGIAQIVRDRFGVPKNFMPIPLECIIRKKINSRNVYLVNDGISKFGLDQDDVLHFAGFGFDGLKGESVITHAARQAIGTALAADQYSGEFFENGANPSVVIKYPPGVAPKPDQQDSLREQFEERYTGKGKRHKPILLTNGGEIQTVSLSAEDAQLLETRKFQVVEIARAFGVPPHMIGETSASTSWGSGIEQMSIGYVRYTLGPHLARFEQELNRKLWPRSYKYFAEFNRDGLLAGDSKTESEVFGKALGGPGAQGYMTVNEVRRIKNLPPVPGGDQILFSKSTAEAKTKNEQDSSVTD